MSSEPGATHDHPVAKRIRNYTDELAARKERCRQEARVEFMGLFDAERSTLVAERDSLQADKDKLLAMLRSSHTELQKEREAHELTTRTTTDQISELSDELDRYKYGKPLSSDDILLHSPRKGRKVWPM